MVNNVTNRTDINAVLNQMREMQMQAQTGSATTGVGQAEISEAVKQADQPEFGEMFKDAVDGVNQQQMKASAMSTAYEQGDPNVDLTQVMINMQKASLSFQAMSQVRNRLVSAYEDIMNMPV